MASADTVRMYVRTTLLSGSSRSVVQPYLESGELVAGRRDEAGKALVKELRAFGSEAEFINADIRKEDDVRAMVDKTIARFGRLDVAVNNAATEGQVGPITDQSAESYAATFDTNVLGVLLSMKHEVRVMQKQGSGSIINISSTTPMVATGSLTWEALREHKSAQVRPWRFR